MDTEEKIVVGFIVGAILLLLGAVFVCELISAKYNKQMFNRMSEGKITYSEAFWGDIKIIPQK